MPSASCIVLYGEYVGYHAATESEVYSIDGYLYTLRQEFNHHGQDGQYVVGRYEGQFTELS